MKYKDLQHYVSQSRLDRFFAACENSKDRTKQLYIANLKLSQAFYPLLNLFEVTLRNVIHYQMTKYFNNSNWIRTEKSKFMSDNSLQPSNYYLRESVSKAERRIQRQRQSVTVDKIIAELTLSFWVGLFDVHHYRLIKGSVIQSFTNLPNSMGRKAIFTRMNSIKEFRNRVYHNEPICFSGNKKDLSRAINTKKEIYNIMQWIDPKIELYAKYFDRIDDNINIVKLI